MEAKRVEVGRKRVLALPPLRGWGLACFRAVWIASLALALVAVAVGQVRDYRTHSERPFSRVGLAWTLEGSEMRLRAPVTEEARRSGIVRGMTIVAVEGHPVGSTIESRGDVESRLKGPEGSSVTLTLRSPDGRISDHRLTRTAAHFDEPLAGSGLTSAEDLALDTGLKGLADLFLLGAGVFLFRGARTSTLAACFSISFVLLVATGPETWQFWLPRNLSYLERGVRFVAEATLAIGLFAFPHGRFDRRWTAWAAGAATALAALDALVPGWSGKAGPIGGAAVFAAAVAAGVQRYHRADDDTGRQQMRWALFGFAWSTALFAVSSTIWWMIGDEISGPLMVWTGHAARLAESLGVGCLTGGLLVSVLRYRLYDIDALLSRSAAYGILTLGFLGLFAGLEKAIEILGEHWFEGSAAAAVTGGMAAGAAALVMVPLHNRVHRWAERRFQKRLLALRREIPEEIEELRDTFSPDELARELVTGVAEALRARHAALLIDGRVCAAVGADVQQVASWQARPQGGAPEAVPEREPADPLFPLRIPLRLGTAATPWDGWLLLGPRPDGSFYGKDERETAAEVAGPIGRAVHAAQARAARQQALEERLEALERAVAALTSRRRTAVAAGE